MRDGYEDSVTREMSGYKKGLFERMPYVRPIALGLSMDHQIAHYKDTRGLAFPLDTTTYLDPVYGQRFTGSLSYFPFHRHIGVYDYSFEPAFIRKRNERERQRVRCVNEGYARLREHLPQEVEDKRLSKVETLRAAIYYIKHLQSLLDVNVSSGGGIVEMSAGEMRSRAPVPKMTECYSDGESKKSDSGELSF
ncbi:achaete-scute homolog 3-like [Salmo trutta]|uniref:Achaete-scute family bHLH transcription factor 4 n=1 Tax=Salmo trutta TaxID=8032 RepID=A0A674EIM4_SALTR|nr:achaete-scute homolog 3-like [Salmo trutta]